MMFSYLKDIYGNVGNSSKPANELDTISNSLKYNSIIPPEKNSASMLFSKSSSYFPT